MYCIQPSVLQSWMYHKYNEDSLLAKTYWGWWSLINGTCFKSSESSAMHFDKWSTRQMQTHKLNYLNNCSLEQSRNVNSLALFGRSMMQGKFKSSQVTGTLHLFYKQLIPSHQMLFTWGTGFLFLLTERFDSVPVDACLGRCHGSLINS